MPARNHFRHQSYLNEPPTAQFELIDARFPPQSGSPEYAEVMNCFGEVLRGSNNSSSIDRVLLIHGTFVGDDALGWNDQIEKLFPAFGQQLGRKLDQWSKQIADLAFKESGNYTEEFRREFENSINRSASTQIPIELFQWSGQNTHSARCRAAVRLLAEYSNEPTNFDTASTNRLHVWCHSHGGNVLAIATNLIGATLEVQLEFLEMVRPVCEQDSPTRQALELLESIFRSKKSHTLPKFEIVNFGTPIRYGWDIGGYEKLLHFVHHRPKPGTPDHLAAPIEVDLDLITKPQGDFVHRIGIANSNFLPFILDSNLVKTEIKLASYLEQGVLRKQYLNRVQHGLRVADEGKSLLVQYDDKNGLARKFFGHGIYTTLEWLAFHAAEVTRFLASS